MNKKQVLTISLGNILEWFDFGLFIFMAPIIGEKFFPPTTPFFTTLQPLVVFAAGFICRPLGGIFFGHLGDTRGRASTLRFSLLVITFATVLIGVLPTYADLGLLASILFILLRLLQGFSIGGEYSGVMIYLAESAPKHQRGFITSFAATGANLGFIFATATLSLCTLLFTPDHFNQWGWRLPFLIIGLPAAVIFYYRFQLTETRVYAHLKLTHHLEVHPFFTALREAPRNLLKILGLTCMSSTLYYVFFGFMPLYLTRYIGIPEQTALLMQTGLLCAMLLLVPLGGWCGDYFGRKKMLVLITVSSILLALPCFYLLQTQSLPLVFLALCIATALSSIDQGNSLTAVVENCPAAVRYSGIAFSYNLGNAVFGGTAPLVMSLLVENKNLLAPAYYLILMSFISLLAALTLLNRNQMLN